MPEYINEVKIKKGAFLYDAVSGLVESKSELRRLVESGAVSEMKGNKITDINFKIEKHNS